jgi:hypothetical protein
VPPKLETSTFTFGSGATKDELDEIIRALISDFSVSAKPTSWPLLCCSDLSVSAFPCTPREVHEAVHGAFRKPVFKKLSIVANSPSPTARTPNKLKGFTGQISIPFNESKGVHGLTGLITQATPHAVQGSRFKVQSSRFAFAENQ